MPHTSRRDQFLTGVRSQLAGQYSTLADDYAPDPGLQPGDKASVQIRKRNRFLAFVIDAITYDRHGHPYHRATHASGEWAVELGAGRFLRGWPDDRFFISAEPELAQEAAATFADLGLLREPRR